MERESKRVLVVGDSASVSLGGLFDNYVDLLASRHAYDRPVELINASSIGTCAPDALAVLQETAAQQQVDAVVVYVGNCDASAFGPVKDARRFTGLASRLGKSVAAPDQGVTPRRNRFCAFAHDPWKPRRRSVTPRDYGVFMADLAQVCARQGIPLIALNPVANPRFPPGNNCGNFLCYSLIGWQSRLSFHGQDADALLHALRLEAEGQGDAARDAYVRIMAGDGDSEAGWVAANNLAVLLWAEGRSGEAVSILERIAAGVCPQASILTYNLALTAWSRGDADAAEALFREAAEKDLGTYRVTAPYRSALAQALAAQRKGGALVLDLGQCLPADSFIDYCHPDLDGHAAIAAALEPRLCEVLGLKSGTHRPVIRQLPENPDRSLGCSGDFFEYYGITQRPDPVWFQTLVADARSIPYAEVLAAADGVVPDADFRKRLAVLTHPVFGQADVLERAQPTAWTDQGSVPELYVLRHMYPLYRLLEDRKGFLDGFPRCRSFILRPGLLDRWLPKGFAASAADLEKLGRLQKGLNPVRVAGRILILLDHMLSAEPSLHQRIRTMTWWFFKEAMLFGTPSHYSLLFRRLDVLKALESCLFATLAGTAPSGQDGVFHDLLSLLEQILATHEQWLAPRRYAIHAMPPEELHGYAVQIAVLRDRAKDLKERLLA